MTDFDDPVGRIRFADVGINAAMTFGAQGDTAVVARFKRLSACNPRTGHVLWQLTDEADEAVTGSAFTRDGQSLATSGGSLQSVRIRVFDLLTGRQRFTVTGKPSDVPGQPAEPDPLLPNSPVFSPDGRLLAFHSTDGGGTLFVCSAMTGEHLWRAAQPASVAGSLSGPSAMSFSADSTLLGYHDGSGIIVADAKSGDQHLEGPHHVTAPTGSLSWRFTPDSRRVVWAQWKPGLFPSVTLTDVDTGLPACTFTLISLGVAAQPGPGRFVWFSQDARRIAIVGTHPNVPGTGALAVFDLELDESNPAPLPTDRIERLPVFTPVELEDCGSATVSFSPGHRFFSLGENRHGGGHRLRVAETDTNSTVWLKEDTNTISSTFSPDGRYLGVWGVSGWDSFQVFAADDPPDPGSDPDFLGTLRSSRAFDTSITDIGVATGTAPIGVAATLGGTDDGVPVDATVTMFDADPDGDRRSVPIRTTIVTLGCGGAPFVAIGGTNGALRVLHKNAVGDWQGIPNDGPLNAVAVAPSGRIIVTGSADKTAWVFSGELAPGEGADHREPLWKSAKHPQGVIRVAVSSDERWIVTGCSNGDASVFANLVDGDHRARRTIASGSRIRSLSFSGTQLFVAGFDNGSAIVVDATMTDDANDLTYQHPAPLTAVCLNSDASLLATATAPPDSTLRIWSVPDVTETPLFTRDYRGPINGIAFSPVKPILAVALASGSVAIVNSNTARDQVRLPFVKGVNKVEFSTDGTVLIAASGEVVNIYNAI